MPPNNPEHKLLLKMGSRINPSDRCHFVSIRRAGWQITQAWPNGTEYLNDFDWRRTMEPFLKSVSLNRDAVTTFDEYPFCIAAIRSLARLELHPRVTFFVGENGTGKSTLLEAIAVAEGFNPEGGSRNFSFATRDSHSSLFQFIRFERGIRRLAKTDGYFFRSESYFNVATQIEELDALEVDAPKVIKSFGGRSLHEQSHGESFWSLLTNRFGGNGLYIFDEPEAALSPSRQLSLLSIFHDLTQQNSQFIVATHSPIVMAFPDAAIYSFSESGIAPTAYQNTEHYKITKAFLDAPDRMLRELFADE